MKLYLVTLTHKFLYGVNSPNPASGEHGFTFGSRIFFPKISAGGSYLDFFFLSRAISARVFLIFLNVVLVYVFLV